MVRQKVVMPKEGISKEILLKKLEGAAEGDVDWKGGKIWSLVYHANDEHTDLLKVANSMYFSKNALSPMAFPSLQKFETEVVAMTIDMLNGDRKAVGSITSGGTESIILAIKTYRDWAKEKFPDIKEPEIVAPSSAHPAFYKGAEYFNVKLIRVPVNKDTHRADVTAMRDAITDNTILIVGSACDFPRGIVDPISDLGSIAHERGIGLHVDACLGGFMLPFVRELGYSIPEFDFSVPGVTSISADVHKYGYGGKGASIIMYRRESLWKHQFCVLTDWSGGIYISTTMRGTRPGGPIAAAWASLKALGVSGYMKLAKIVMDASEKLMEGIKKIPELFILGTPDMSVFSFASEEINIYQLGDVMDKKGWHLDRLQNPEALHMMVNPHHAKIIDSFLNDLKAAVQEVKKSPEKSTAGQAAMYGMVASLPDKEKTKNYIINFLKSQYKL